MPNKLRRGAVVALLRPAPGNSHPCGRATSLGPAGLLLEGIGGWAPRPRAGPAGSWCAHLQLRQEVWKCKRRHPAADVIYLFPGFRLRSLLNQSCLRLLTAGERWDGAGGSVCWDLLPAPFRRKPGLPQSTLLHLHLHHYDWWGGGALSGRPQPHRQVQETFSAASFSDL